MRRKRHWSYTGEKRRLRVLKRDNYECQIRGPHCRGLANSVDHIHPRELGGTEDESNLQAACVPCNSWKGRDSGAGRAFFNSGTNRVGRLLKIPPHSRWGVIRSDYSRSEADDGGSAA